MSAPSQSPQERAFQCIHCNGRIVIPANLPATTGPCPHCKGTITSPEPGAASPFIVQDTKPKNETTSVSSARTPSAQTPSTPTPSASSTSSAPRTTAVPVTYEAPEELQEKEAEKSVPPKKSDKKSSPVLLILLLVIILGTVAGGAYYVLVILKSKGEADNPLTLKQPAKPSTNPTLEKFLTAATLDEKLNHVLNAEALRPKIEAFYKDKSISETDTPANLFNTVQISETDSKKGFVLLNYDQAGAKPTTDRTKILAFLKETEQGLKLDWDVYAQTKYRMLNYFIKSPVVGKSEVFRVVITKDPASKSPGYLLTDPVHQTDSIQVTEDPKSPSGQLLANLDQESAKISGPAKRTATVELTWAGDPNKPQLQIKRLICWEFLNLGGKEIAETAPSN